MALTFVNTLRSRATVGFGDISSTVANIGTSYQKLTSPECKTIDAFLAFAMLTGVAQAVYCLLGSSYPYNAFLGVFAASVGLFVFAVNVRLQWDRRQPIKTTAILRSIAEFLVCAILLNLFVANFIG